MSKKKIKSSFLLQGSILAVAGLLVRVIGLIYRVPLTNILGEKGMGCYGTAYDVYNILILLSSQSMPIAVSKLVSEKLGKNENNNAHRIFKGALIYGLVIGVICGLIAFFGGEWLASTFYHAPSAGRALKVLAPTLTIACILGVFRGYMQGLGNMVPTAISQIFEQIVNAFVSVFAAYELLNYGYSVSTMLSESKAEANAISYGAAGGTLGTCLGAATALLVLIIIYLKRKSDILADISKQDKGALDSFSRITKMIIFTITPMLISTTIYNISNLLDNPIFQNIMELKFGLKEDARLALWGVYSSQYRVLTTMPIAIASALAAAIVPSMIRSYAAGDKLIVNNKIDSAIKFSMIIALPCGFGLSVLGGPINKMLFPNLSNDMIVYMMMFSVFTVTAFSLSTISNSILQGIDKLNVPIKNSAISLVIHLVILPLLLVVFKLGIYAVVIGDFTFAMTVCVLNSYSIKNYTGYTQEIKNTFVKPIISSVIMSICCYLVYLLFHKLIGSNTISTLIAICVAIAVYGIMVIKTKIVTENELESVPKGTMIIKICKKFHLL